MAISAQTVECSLPGPHGNSVSLQTQSENSGLMQRIPSTTSEDQPTENTSVPEDESVAQQDSGTIAGRNSHQSPPADRGRSDSYGLLAARLASRATEEEINFIEAQIKGLKARKETLEDLLEQAKNETSKDSGQANEDVSEKRTRVVAIPSLKCVEWDDFVNNTWCDCNDYVTWALHNGINRQPHAIDVLVGNACYFWQLEPEPDTLGHGDLPVVPERIRINSRPLLAFLRKLSNRNDDTPFSHVVLRPYKILLHHESSIRQHAEELGRKWGHLAAIDNGACEGTEHLRRDAKDQILQASPPSSSEASISEALPKAVDAKPPQVDGISYSEKGDDSENGDDRLNDSVEAWKDFVCLTNFMDRYVRPVARKFGGDEVQKARFQDLWYLFKPGDDILVNQAHRRAGRGTEKYAVWRVFHVTGGRPLLSSGVNSNPLFLGTRDKMSQFAIVAYRIIFDGQKYGTVSKQFTVDPFSGQKDITSLEVYPLRFATNKNTILKDVAESGKKFIELTSTSGPYSHRHRSYLGSTVNVDHAGEFCKPAGDTIAQVSGQVIIDIEEAYQHNPGWIPTAAFPPFLGTESRECDEENVVTCWKDADRNEAVSEPHGDIFSNDLSIDQKITEQFMANDKFLSAYKRNEEQPDMDSNSLSEKDLLLLPKHVCAFVLKRRTFALLNIDGLEPFVAQEKGWTELKLPKGHKDMVEAQAMSHFRDKSRKIQARERDIIRGKGQGLIILLHGFPGVGKTSTAECLAAKLGNPLYPITCGDLGMTVELVEKRLETIFSKAQKWNCVLLLDEADVFLAERTKTDIERNALVSLFLRTLEYYDGLLFLTTNRVGTLDEAFKSRIHMRLYYPPLKQAQMKAIWEVNLKRIQGYRDDIDPNINDILSYPDELWYQLEQEGRTQWNGRPIRNAFQTALALAENDHFKQHPDLLGQDQPYMNKIRLEKKHFITVATTINTFDDYLGTAHPGNSHSKIAYDRGQRADNYGQQTRQQHYYANPNTSGYESYNRGGGAGGNAAAYYVPAPPNRSPSSGYPAAPPPQPGRGMLWPPAPMAEMPPSPQQQHNRGLQDHNIDQNPTQQYHQHQPEHLLVHRAPDDDEFA